MLIKVNGWSLAVWLLVIAAGLVLVGHGVTLHFNPYQLATSQASATASASPRQGAVYFTQPHQREAALTFDVGSGKKIVNQVISTLQKHHVEATFFVSGTWAPNHRQVIERMIADGDDVESHGFQHVKLNRLPPAQVKKNLQQARKALSQVTGHEPRFLRPPYGFYNQRVLQVASQLGMQTVIWSVETNDWQQPGSKLIYKRVVDQAFPGSIVLMHANSNTGQTAKALPQIIDTLQHDGYHLVTVPQLLSDGQPADHWPSNNERVKLKQSIQASPVITRP